MNERLQELAVQARAETYAHFDDETFDWDVWHTVFQHKFAELIVRECIEQASIGNGHGNNQWDRALTFSAKNIKEHFGVEE